MCRLSRNARRSHNGLTRGWKLVGTFSQVRAVCAGHVHQQFESESNGVRLLTTPSSALQFKPGADEFAMDDAAAGFRILYLDEHELRTEVVRVPA